MMGLGQGLGVLYIRRANLLSCPTMGFLFPRSSE